MSRRRAGHGKIGVQGFAAQRAASSTPADSESGDAGSIGSAGHAQARRPRRGVRRGRRRGSACAPPPDRRTAFLSNASIGVLGFTMRSFLRLRLGEMGCVFSRVNTNWRSTSPHSKHPRVWCSKPGPAWCRPAPPASHTFLPRTLSIALQLLPFNAACVVPIPRAFRLSDVQARAASRRAAPPLSYA